MSENNLAKLIFDFGPKSAHELHSGMMNDMHVAHVTYTMHAQPFVPVALTMNAAVAQWRKSQFAMLR